MRRIAVLMTLAADDQQSQRRITAFVQGLEKLGWADGRNVRMEYRWSAANAVDIRKYAAELVALAPDVILAAASPAVGAFYRQPPPCRSCSSMSPILSALDMPTAWPEL